MDSAAKGIGGLLLIASIGVALFLGNGLNELYKNSLDPTPLLGEKGPSIDLVKFDRGMIGRLPLTKHAQYDHPERIYNAGKIQELMTNGICKPIEAYSCPDKGQFIFQCPFEGASGKLTIFIARDTGVIITGFPDARPETTEGCNGPLLIP